MTVPEYLGAVTATGVRVDPTTGAATVELTIDGRPTTALLELEDEARQHLAAALGGPAVLAGV